MFLSNLSEEQKEGFLDLCIYIMELKEIVKDTEVILLKKYCAEMGVAYRIEKREASVEKLLSKLKDDSTAQELKRIALELVAMIYADDVIDEQEHKFLMGVKEYFGFTSHQLEDLIFVTRHLLLSMKLIDNVKV